MSHEEKISRLFDYHRPTPEQAARYERIGAAVKQLALVLYECCPEGTDLDAAIQRLRETRMLANAAIACAPKPSEAQDG